MAYTKTTFVNNSPPAINADNLNKMEQGIYDAHIIEMLLCDEVMDTTQTYTFSGGSVSKVEHKSGNTAIRTDVFTYGENTITEVRTLNTGEKVTIVTNLTTLETTVTYAAA